MHKHYTKHTPNWVIKNGEIKLKGGKSIRTLREKWGIRVHRWKERESERNLVFAVISTTVSAAAIGTKSKTLFCLFENGAFHLLSTPTIYFLKM